MKKKSGLFTHVLFFLNSLFAFLLLAAYLLPLIPPHVFPELSVLTLLVPVFIVINLGFVIYWLLFLKKHFLLSTLVLLLGFFQDAVLFRFSGNSEEPSESLGIMSYNVRLFNSYKELEEEDVARKIWDFIKSEDPDIICFQEFVLGALPTINAYPYSYKTDTKNKHAYGQAIFSKYPIVNEGSLNFPATSNNGIYVDILYKNDTLRVYNLHMQSLSLKPQLSGLQQQNKRRLLGRLGNAFTKQEQQTDLFLAHQSTCTYPIFVAGDFNNTVYSHTYQQIKGDKKDAFAQIGSGFGRTFIFDFIPLRIDYLLYDDKFEVTSFSNYTIRYSDHYPIKATFKLVPNN